MVGREGEGGRGRGRERGGHLPRIALPAGKHAHHTTQLGGGCAVKR